MEQQTGNSFDQWCVLSLMGHKRLAGKVSETNIAGHGFLRIDIPDKEGNIANTEFYSPTSVYSIQPISKEVAIAVASEFSTPPVTKWEIKNLLPPAPPIEHDDGPDDNYDDDNDDEGLEGF